MMTSESATSHGSLFLRIGAILFGLGTVIYSGMEFLTFFEIPKSCRGWSALLGANPGCLLSQKILPLSILKPNFFQFYTWCLSSCRCISFSIIQE